MDNKTLSEIICSGASIAISSGIIYKILDKDLKLIPSHIEPIRLRSLKSFLRYKDIDYLDEESVVETKRMRKEFVKYFKRLGERYTRRKIRRKELKELRKESRVIDDYLKGENYFYE